MIEEIENISKDFNWLLKITPLVTSWHQNKGKGSSVSSLFWMGEGVLIGVFSDEPENGCTGDKV